MKMQASFKTDGSVNCAWLSFYVTAQVLNLDCSEWHLVGWINIYVVWAGWSLRLLTGIWWRPNPCLLRRILLNTCETRQKVPGAFINAQIYVNSKSLRETTGTTRRIQRPNRTGGRCKSEEPPYWKVKHRRARGNLTPPAGVICYWNCVVVLRDSMCRLLLESRSKVWWLWFVLYCLHRFLSPLLHLLPAQYRVIVQQQAWK